LDEIKIDTNERTITFPARVNMQKGLVEVFLCSRGGKTHESIFVTDITPYFMQVALLMIGLKPADPEQYLSPDTPISGDPVQINVSWTDSLGTQHRYEGDELVWNMANGKPMRKTRWVFVGSQTINGKFMADDVKSIITTYNDPTTIIDNPLSTGRNDELYSSHEALVPAKGTGVSIEIKALP
jgi:hypothetical protein